MRRWPFVALLLIPLADALVLVYVATLIGGPATVALVVLTALIGLLLVRAEGRHTMASLQRKIVRGDLPTDELMDGGLLIAAGAFLLTPGLVTDTLGLLLALPPTRFLFREGLKRWVVVPAFDSRTGGLVTGDVYTFGFPDGGDGGDVHDMGPDAFDIDLEDEDGEKGDT